MYVCVCVYVRICVCICAYVCADPSCDGTALSPVHASVLLAGIPDRRQPLDSQLVYGCHDGYATGNLTFTCGAGGFTTSDKCAGVRQTAQHTCVLCRVYGNNNNNNNNNIPIYNFCACSSQVFNTYFTRKPYSGLSANQYSIRLQQPVCVWVCVCVCVCMGVCVCVFARKSI
jgi:hypothetical protein